MFDSLKEKLGTFREEAEEAVEDADEAEETEEPEGIEGIEFAPEAELGTEAAGAEAEEAEPVPESEPEPEPEPDAGVGPDVESAVDRKPAEPTEPEAAGTVEAEDAADATGTDVAGGSADVAETDVTDDTTDTDEAPSPAGASGAADDDAPGDAIPLGEDVTVDGMTVEEFQAAIEEEETGPGMSERARLLASGKAVVDEEDIEGPLEDLELALLSSDVEMGVADEILEGVRDRVVNTTRTRGTGAGEIVENALRESLIDVMSVGQFDFDERVADAEKPLTIVFTGVNGVGKTTTIAKLARRFEEQGYSVVLANGDTYRAGANEQIARHAENLDARLISHEQGGDPAAVLYDAVEYAEAHDADVVLGDTAGRLHTSSDLMEQLAKIDRVVDPDMTLFVDEAVAGQDAVNRAREFDEAAAIDGTVLTKADADANGGAAISIAHVTGRPILFLGVGQGYDDLERFDPDRMVARLLGEPATDDGDAEPEPEPADAEPPEGGPAPE